MKEYITEAVQEFGEDFSQVVTSPVARWLFKVVKVREPQCNRLDTFHTVFMKLICILQRG